MPSCDCQNEIPQTILEQAVLTSTVFIKEAKPAHGGMAWK